MGVGVAGRNGRLNVLARVGWQVNAGRFEPGPTGSVQRWVGVAATTMTVSLVGTSETVRVLEAVPLDPVVAAALARTGPVRPAWATTEPACPGGSPWKVTSMVTVAVAGLVPVAGWSVLVTATTGSVAGAVPRATAAAAPVFVWIME